MQIDDPRPYAHFIQNFREKGDVGAKKVMTMNVMWTVYNTMQDLDEGEVEITEEEARQILSEFPTSYDEER